MAYGLLLIKVAREEVEADFLSHYNGLDFDTLWEKDKRKAANLAARLPTKSKANIKLNPYFYWDEQDWINARSELMLRVQNMKKTDAEKQKIELPWLIQKAEERRKRTKKTTRKLIPGSKEHLEESRRRLIQHMENVRKNYGTADTGGNSGTEED